jgi:hypothetical protein
MGMKATIPARPHTLSVLYAVFNILPFYIPYDQGIAADSPGKFHN